MTDLEMDVVFFEQEDSGYFELHMTSRKYGGKRLPTDIKFDDESEAIRLGHSILDVMDEWPTCPNECHMPFLTANWSGLPVWMSWRLILPSSDEVCTRGPSRTDLYPHLSCGDHILSPWGMHRFRGDDSIVPLRPLMGVNKRPREYLRSVPVTPLFEGGDICDLSWSIRRAPIEQRYWVIRCHVPGHTRPICLGTEPPYQTERQVLDIVRKLAPTRALTCSSGCHCLLPHSIFVPLNSRPSWTPLKEVFSSFCEESGQLLAPRAIVPVRFRSEDRLPDVLRASTLRRERREEALGIAPDAVNTLKLSSSSTS